MDILTRKQLSLLIQLAKSDRDFSQQEKELIKSIARRYNVSMTELLEVVQNPTSVDDLYGLSEDQKIEYLYNAILLAKADNRLMPNEILLINNIARKLGFKRQLVQAMIPLVKDPSVELVNFGALRRRLSPYF